MYEYACIRITLCVPFRETHSLNSLPNHPHIIHLLPKIQLLFTHPNQPAIKHFATLSPYRMKQHSIRKSSVTRTRKQMWRREDGIWERKEEWRRDRDGEREWVSEKEEHFPRDDDNSRECVYCVHIIVHI